jgi:hypothetical protein
MSSPLNVLLSVPEDKLRHFVAGSIAATIGCCVDAGFCGLSPATPFVGFWVAISVGVFKELSDGLDNAKARAACKSEPHEVSAEDLKATVAGAAPVVLPLVAAILGGLYT